MSKVSLFQPSNNQLPLPLVTNRVPAGFPSPCEEYLNDTLDLNAYVIRDPVTTFFARVEGESMIDAGILPDDIVVVDRSIEAQHNHVVIAVLNGEFTIKRLSTLDGLKLVADNPDYADIPITGEAEFSIWGVVTFRIGKV